MVYNGTNDLYAYFFERGINLLKENGYFGFIVSSKFIKTRYGKELRKFILDNTQIVQFIDFGELPVFEDATTYPCIIILKKSSKVKKRKENKILISKVRNLNFINLSEEVNSTKFFISQEMLNDETWMMEDNDIKNIKQKMEKAGTPLRKFINEKLYRGITTGYNDAFIIDEKTKNNLIQKDKNSEKIIKKFLTGKNIKRYSVKFNNLYLIFTYTGIKIDEFPAIKDYLTKFKSKLDVVWEVKHKKHPWYELRGCSYYPKFESPKIVFPRINIHPNFTLDLENYFTQDSSFIIPSSSKYLLGILNSKLLHFYANKTCSLLRGNYYDYRYQYVENFPIVIGDKKISNVIEEKVANLLNLHKKLHSLDGKQTDEKVRLEKEIKKVDDEIDQEVYRIYGITKEEQKIIEESLK